MAKGHHLRLGAGPAACPASGLDTRGRRGGPRPPAGRRALYVAPGPAVGRPRGAGASAGSALSPVPAHILPSGSESSGCIPRGPGGGIAGRCPLGDCSCTPGGGIAGRCPPGDLPCRFLGLAAPQGWREEAPRLLQAALESLLCWWVWRGAWQVPGPWGLEGGSCPDSGSPKGQRGAHGWRETSCPAVSPALAAHQAPSVRQMSALPPSGSRLPAL